MPFIEVCSRTLLEAAYSETKTGPLLQRSMSEPERIVTKRPAYASHHQFRFNVIMVRAYVENSIKANLKDKLKLLSSYAYYKKQPRHLTG